jgi:hypothetical protein
MWNTNSKKCSRKINDRNDSGSHTFSRKFLHRKKSNSRNSKSTYSHDTIKVTLEREYNVQHEFKKNAGGKITTVMIRGHTLWHHHFLSRKKSNDRNSKSNLVR